MFKEEFSLRQKSRVREGDNKSKFFHRVANGNRLRKVIDKLELDNGLVIGDEKLIEEGLLDSLLEYI